MLTVRDFKYEDSSKIELNDYAIKHSNDHIYLLYYFNFIEAKTIIDENDKIHAIVFCGKYPDEEQWYGWATYSKDCSKMVVRQVRKLLLEYLKNGYNIITINDSKKLEKFHEVIFRGVE